MISVGFWHRYSRGREREGQYVARFLLHALGVQVRFVNTPAEIKNCQRLIIYTDVEDSDWQDNLPPLTLIIPAHFDSDDMLQVTGRLRERPLPILGPRVVYPQIEGYPYSYQDGGSPLQLRSSRAGIVLKLGWDLLAAVFHLLTLRWESGFESEPEILQIIQQEPVIDRYLAFLRLLLDLADENTDLVPLWPRQNKYAVALSHDVDMLIKWRSRTRFKWWLQAPGKMLQRRGNDLTLDRREMKQERDPYDNLHQISTAERRRGFYSTWFFLTEGHDHRTFRYHLHDDRVRKAIAELKQDEQDFGLHGGSRSAHLVEKFREQKLTLESVLELPLSGVRQHWLKLNTFQTWDAQAKSGFEWDSTLGWNEKIGYRAGVSLPFPLFDPQRSQELPLWEIPLVIMDTAMFLEMKLSPHEVLNIIEQYLERTRRTGGLLTILFHNHFFHERDFPGWSGVYERLLEQLAAEPAWVTSVNRVMKRWQTRWQQLSEPLP